MKIGPIEKEVPIRRGEPFDWPLDEMQVGDSFLITAGEDEDLPLLRRRLSTATRRRERADNKKFCYRTINEDSIRCWRTE